MPVELGRCLLVLGTAQRKPACAAPLQVYGVLPGKNSFGNTKAAALPGKKKPYYSIVVPTVLAEGARTRCVRIAGSPTTGEDVGRFLTR